MRIDILTLFPEMFTGFINESIIKRAIDKKLVNINIINFRNYTTDPHNKVDDTPFGGGAGMVLMPQPIFDAVEDIRTDDSFVVLLTPSGKTYNQKVANCFKGKKHLILICGHYEGFDERVKTLCDLEISIGDYILTGGEVAAMAICDSTVRLLDGVISKESLQSESFDGDLLDYPVYTKPRDFRGMLVPDVLLSGNHKEIEEYRKREQIRLTNEKLGEWFYGNFKTFCSKKGS